MATVVKNDSTLVWACIGGALGMAVTSAFFYRKISKLLVQQQTVQESKAEVS